MTENVISCKFADFKDITDAKHILLSVPSQHPCNCKQLAHHFCMQDNFHMCWLYSSYFFTVRPEL